MALTTAGWIATISLALAAKHANHTLILGRLGFAFASAMPFTLIWMVDALARSREDVRRTHFLSPRLFSALFVIASMSPWIVAGSAKGPQRANFVYGPLHKFFAVYFLVFFAYGLFTLWKASRSASGITRLQLRYLLMGISLTGAGAITTNLLIPVIWRTSQYSALGPYFCLLFFSFSAHAIIRHRLMDIRVFIRKGTVYAATITSLAIIFALIAPPLARAAGYEHERIPLLWASIVAVALAVLFQPLKDRIQRYMNRYVYRETYDFQQTVRELSRTLNTILDFASLLRYLGAAVERIFQCEIVRIYLLDPSSGVFIDRTSPSVAFDPKSTHLDQLSASSPLVACLRDRRRPLVREEALRTAIKAPLAAADQLHALGGEIALPLADEQTLSGFLIVGPKKSGDPYFVEDLDLLSTFMSQATTALKNAQLYRQVVFVNEYIENILRTMDSGVITVDAHGKIALVNSTAERLTGLSRPLLKSMTIDQLPRSLASPLRATLSDGQPRPQVEGIVSRDALRRTPVVCSTSALRDDRDLVVGALIVFNDLTQVKALESEKRRAERLAAFGTLVSGIAHEIKNPLVAIRTFAELLPDRFSETDFREDFSKVVITEIDRIDRLVGRLRGLAVSSVQHVATIDIREPVNETLALLRGQLEQTQTAVHREFLDSTLLVSVDPSQLKQLFLNLFLNAIEAMGVGGQLTVRVRRRQVDNGTWIAAEVLDSGPGIDESIRAHIFDPFFTTKPRGSGLGLAICRGIMDAHRGTIRAENNPEGVGTTIVVEFPAVSEEAGLLETKTVST